MPEFDPTRPVQTRDGRKAEILCTDLYPPLSIGVKITDRNGTKHAGFRTKDGRCYSNGQDSFLDLVNIPEKRVGWLNIHEVRGSVYLYYCHTRKDADAMAGVGRIACIPFEYTPGEGLEPAENT